MAHYHEPELQAPVDLARADGRLNRAAVGWSRHPVHRCNLTWSERRPKRWNYWCFTGPDHLVSIAVSDRGIVAAGSVTFLRYADRRFHELVAQIPFDTGQGLPMPERVRGDLTFQHDGVEILMRETGPTETELRGRGHLPDGTLVEAHIVVERPAEHETLNVVIPWSDETYQFTSKQECLPAEGRIRIGREVFAFAPGSAFGTLDYGRGFWPSRSIWNWAAASGRQSGRVVGLNLGGKWTDGTGMNENGFVIDGQLTKIHEDLVWEYDDRDFMRPWRIYAPSTGLVDVVFSPVYERRNETAVPEQGYERRVSQVFGHFEGTIRPRAGEAIELSGLFGWAEELTAVW